MTAPIQPAALPELTDEQKARIEVIRVAYATGFRSGTINEALEDIAREFLALARASSTESTHAGDALRAILRTAELALARDRILPADVIADRARAGLAAPAPSVPSAQGGASDEVTLPPHYGQIATHKLNRDGTGHLIDAIVDVWTREQIVEVILADRARRAQAVAPSDPHDELSCVDCGASGDVHFPACPEAAVAPQPVGLHEASADAQKFYAIAALIRAGDTVERAFGKYGLAAPISAASPSPAPDTADERRADTARIDWLGAHQRDASIRLEDGSFHACNVWAVSADKRWTIREAIDAARAAAPGSVNALNAEEGATDRFTIIRELPKEPT